MKQDLQDARRTFPNMPEEVFTLWLDGRILARGWPPSGIEWDGLLFGRSVADWQALTWSKRSVNVTWDTLGPLSRQLVQQLIEGNVNGKRNLMMAYIPDSKQRFQQITQYAIEHGNVPGTVILLRVGQLFEIVEGNHRIAVLIALRSFRETKDKMVHPQAAWVGEWGNTEPAPGHVR